MNYASSRRSPPPPHWIVDGLYGFLVYGNLLTSEFAAYPDVFRPLEAMNAMMPFLFAGLLLAMFVAAYIYAKGYEGGSGVAGRVPASARCSACSSAATSTLVNYAVLQDRQPARWRLAWSCRPVVEWLDRRHRSIGLVYKPAVGPRRLSRSSTVQPCEPPEYDSTYDHRREAQSGP